MYLTFTLTWPLRSAELTAKPVKGEELRYSRVLS